MQWLANTFEAAATQAEKLAGLADIGPIFAEAEANFGELLLLRVVLQQLQVGQIQALPGRESARYLASHGQQKKAARLCHLCSD